MKRFGIFLFICFGLTFCSCESEPNSSNGNHATEAPTDNSGGEPEKVIEQPVKPDCNIEGTVLKSNEFWAQEENLIVTVVAAPETNDPDFGESHRLFEVYDGATCEVVFRQVLPVNRSPDFPYYLSEITYNKVNRLIAVRGFDKFYIFDLSKKELAGPIRPKFLNERFVEDAQAGQILRLEVWEEYVIGHAQSMGSFVFDLKNPQTPKAVLPSAEYEIIEGTEYSSLFVLFSSDENNGEQLIIPQYDYENETFTVGALLEEPAKLDTKINKNVRDNRFIVVKELLGEKKNRPIGIDMKQRRKVDIPEAIADQKVTEIVAWMKGQ